MVEFDQIKWRGKTFATGLHEPISRKTEFPMAAEKMIILDKKEIVRAATHKSRVSKRTIFDSSTIKNQGRAGSCCGQASAVSLAKARYLAGQDWIELSGEFVYSKINDNRDQGALLDDGMEALKEFGAAAYDPTHHEQYRRRAFSKQDEQSAKRFRAFDCVSINSEWELASALVGGWICVVAVHANSAFMKIDSRGIAGPSARGNGNHAVHVDDLIVDRNGILLFDMANSWGAQWGDSGRAYLSWRDHLSRTNRFHYFYAVRSVTDDPNDSIPD